MQSAGLELQEDIEDIHCFLKESQSWKTPDERNNIDALLATGALIPVWTRDENILNNMGEFN